jgi:hypothetical protein
MVDSQWADTTEVPAALTSQEKKDNEKNVYTEVIIKVDDQMDTWVKIYESGIANIPYSLLDKWTSKPASDFNKTLTVDHLQFFTAMKEWNPTLFTQATEPATGWSGDDGVKRIDRWAVWLYGAERPDKKVNFPDIDYCTPLIAENLRRIYMKFPIMPNTSDYINMVKVDEKRILLYELGKWTMQIKEDVEKQYVVGVQ